MVARTLIDSDCSMKLITKMTFRTFKNAAKHTKESSGSKRMLSSQWIQAMRLSASHANPNPSRSLRYLILCVCHHTSHYWPHARAI